ncbi:hypothetical protein V2I01_06210 [Micromonospora sp. BRA006-A]|nr:hypothetical protein [Micromonospora sp. BRA006-A]
MDDRRPGQLLPDAAAAALRRADGPAPPAPGHRHHGPGQRGDQPGRHLVRLPGGRGDGGVRRRRARAYVVVREVFGLRDLWDAVEALDNKVSPELQTAVYLDPAAARPRGALAGHQPALADRRAGGDRPAARRWPGSCRTWRTGSGAPSGRPSRRTSSRWSSAGCRVTWPSRRPA